MCDSLNCIIYLQTCDSSLEDRLKNSVLFIGVAGVVFAIAQVCMFNQLVIGLGSVN